jgi:hypothetical protein
MRRRRASEGGGASGGAGEGKPPPNLRRRTLWAFAGFSGSSSSSSTRQSSTPLLPIPPPSPLGPLPQWGRLIDDGCVRAARLRRFLQSMGPIPPPSLRRHFTIPYGSPFNDCFNRTPGQGSAGSYGAWGSGVRSALNRGSMGAAATSAEPGGAAEAMLLIGPGGSDDVAEGEAMEQQPTLLDMSAASSFASSASDGGTRSGSSGSSGSNHRRNFTLIATWALGEGSGGLIEDAGDTATLRSLLHECVRLQTPLDRSRIHPWNQI